MVVIKKVHDDDARHKFCPEGLESWCKYQKQKVAGEISYKPKINIPEAVRDVINPFFSYKDRAADDLLKKCLRGQTRNANKAFIILYMEKGSKGYVCGKENTGSRSCISCKSF